MPTKKRKAIKTHGARLSRGTLPNHNNNKNNNMVKTASAPATAKASSSSHSTQARARAPQQQQAPRATRSSGRPAPVRPHMAHPGGRQAPRHAPVGTNSLRRDAHTGRFFREAADGNKNNNNKQYEDEQQQQHGAEGPTEGMLPPGGGYGFGRTSAPNFGGGFAASMVRPTASASSGYYPCNAPGARCF